MRWTCLEARFAQQAIFRYIARDQSINIATFSKNPYFHTFHKNAQISAICVYEDDGTRSGWSIAMRRKGGQTQAQAAAAEATRDLITRTVGHSRDFECHPVRSSVPQKEYEQRSN